MDIIGGNSHVALFLLHRGRELLLQYYDTEEIAHLDESISCARQALDASLPSERAVYLNDLACRLHQRFERFGEIPDISEAIQLTEQAIVTIGDSSKPVVLNNLATYLGERFDGVQDVADLDRGIATGQDALNASGSDIGLRARSLCNLALLHGHRFSKLNSLEDLEDAIRMGEQGLQITPQDHEDKPMQLANLGTYYERRFVRFGWRADIQKAIECAQEALGLSDDEKEHLICFQNLSNALASRHSATNDPQDLQSAIENAERAVCSTPQDHPNWPHLVHNLSVVLKDRFFLFEDMCDIDRAIDLENSAIAAISSDDPALAVHWDHVGFLLALQFDFNGDTSLLDTSISLGQAAVNLNLTTDDDDPDLPGYLSHLSAGICRRFDRTNDLCDLDQAIRLARQALDAAPRDDPRHINLLLDLGDYLHNRYIKMGSVEALEEAVKLTEDASKTDSPYSFHRPYQLCTLSRRLRDRYQYTRAVQDIQMSIELAQEAVHLVPSDHPRRVDCLHCRSRALQENFMATGSIAHLEEAIRSSQETLAVSSPGHPDRAGFLYDLSTQLVLRYEQFGALVDLEEAIHLMQESRENKASNHSLGVSCLLALSDQFGYYFERDNDMDKLNQAIDFAKEAGALCANGDMARVGILNSMSLLLGIRFQKTGSQADLSDAIGAQHQALECAPDGYAQRDIILGNLSARMADQFRQTRRTENLTEAIRLCREAIETAPKHHPNRAMYLNRIGTLLKEDSAESIPDNAKNLTPLDYFLEALHHQSSPPLDRIKAGQNAFDSYVVHGKWDKASLVARDTVGLFHLLIPRWLSRDDQQHLLENITHFTSSAASATLQANGDPTDALEILEAGRGVIASLTADLKADISRLEQVQPSLHAEYAQLRRHILLPYASSFLHAPETASMIPTKRKTSRRLSTHIATTGFQRAESIRRLEELESKIRSLPEFEHFLERLTPSSYVPLARPGPIVAFNATALRSDAVIVTRDGIDSIHLDRLQFDELKANVTKVIGKNQLARGKLSTKPQRNEELRTIMEWLWDVAVHPVLTRLGLYQGKPPNGPLPRIWWVASGYMGLLPLHAAGTREYTAMDYVVSSYTPTLQVLKFSRERHHNLISCPPDLRMLIVPAPEKRGQADLQTHAEIESIKNGLHEDISYTVLDRPTSIDVLRELSQHHLIHFSCHGSSDSLDPSSSALVLSSNTPEDTAHSYSLLTVRDLSAIDHDQARIAYLSACSTAENSSDGLLDEIIHLASSFQLAGFPHVVGTLWEVRDEATVQVTGLFYRALGERLRSVGGFRDGDVAYALHEAVQLYRKSKRVMRSNDVLSWVPFIYMGGDTNPAV